MEIGITMPFSALQHFLKGLTLTAEVKMINHIVFLANQPLEWQQEENISQYISAEKERKQILKMVRRQKALYV